MREEIVKVIGEITLVADWGVMVQPTDGGDAYPVVNEDWEEWYNYSKGTQV